MDLQTLNRFDTEQMYKIYDEWPDISKESFNSELTKFDIKGIDHVIFAGMGGSGSVGDTISAIFSKKDIHVNVVKGYELPNTVDSNTLIITTSVSGNTPETLQILKNSIKTPAKVIGFSSGGLMEKFCHNENILYQKIPMIHSPRVSFTRFLYSILNILEPILPICRKDVEQSIRDMEKSKKQIFSGNLNEDNISLNLAKFTKDVITIYYPSGLKSSAIRYKNCLQENAKVHAMIEDVIESCHNGIVSWEKESIVNPVMIQGSDDHTKTKERWGILEEFFDLKNINYMKINSVEGGILSKIVNLNYLLDYSSIYTAIMNKIDPTPVKSIDYIKSKL